MNFLYAYDPATQACHVYAASGDGTADLARARQMWPTWSISIIAETPLSVKFELAACRPRFALYCVPFSYPGGNATPTLNVSDDPAALDALGAARQAGAAFSYMVLPVEAL